jgi:hypothetical protein
MPTTCPTKHAIKANEYRIANRELIRKKAKARYALHKNVPKYVRIAQNAFKSDGVFKAPALIPLDLQSIVGNFELFDFTSPRECFMELSDDE